MFDKTFSWIKKHKVLFALGIVVLLLLPPALLNGLYFYGEHLIVKNTSFDASDLLNYITTFLTFLGTILLSLLALYQNDRLHKLEEKSLIANNTCAPIIKKINFVKTNQIIADIDQHIEQILLSNSSNNCSGVIFTMIITWELLTPNIASFIRVRNAMILCENSNGITACTFFNNPREEYSRLSITKKGCSHKLSLIIDNEKDSKIGNELISSGKKIILELDMNIVSMNYVSSKCKCRVYMTSGSIHGKLSYTINENKSASPMVFLYESRICSPNEIKVFKDIE